MTTLLHGYGGGYLPPILGSRSRPSAHIPNEPFRAGMIVVIQPNVVTRDGKAGVQTGEMVLITATGIETIPRCPARLRAGVTARRALLRRRLPVVLNGVLPEFVKSAGAHCSIINESLRAQNSKRDAVSRHVSCAAPNVVGSNFVKDISSLRTMRDTHRKEYRFKQFSA